MSKEEIIAGLEKILIYINGDNNLLTNNPKTDRFTALLKIKGMIEIIYEKLILGVDIDE